MINEQVKCPVCGEGLDRHEEYLGHIDSNPKECCIEGYWTELQLEQIQVTIDKAVQEERERCTAIAKEIYEGSLLTEWQRIKLMNIVTGAAK